MSEPVPDELTTPQVLRAAAAQIRKRGWNQGWFFNEAGAICLSAAFNVALGAADPAVFPYPGTRQHELRRGGMDALRLVIGDANPVIWNDRDGRTVDEVLAALEAAAVAEEEKARAQTPGDSGGQGPDH